jgi:DNA-binding transcriptional regulator YdaS (Cro superfamily)
MKLSDWLKQTKTRKYQFAERIGVAPSVVGDYCKGLYVPRPSVAVAIMRETAGQVTANDFLPLSPEAGEAQPEAAQ